MTIQVAESKRIKKFRVEVVAKIPCFPNTKSSRHALEKLSLASLLVHYNNWAIRYVKPFPRNVHVEDSAALDSRWQQRSAEISMFLERVKKGEDLTPYLSLAPHTRGYTPASSEVGPNTNRWADKDFLLNVMGYHHFHLGMPGEQSVPVERKNELLFARVTRDLFEVVAITDHSVFDQSVSNQRMSPERERLWTIFDAHSSRGGMPNSVYMGPMISTSGHSVYLVSLASRYARIIHEVDEKLNEKSFVQGLYDSAGVTFPKRPKLEWTLKYLDLGLLDQKSATFFVLQYGVN